MCYSFYMPTTYLIIDAATGLQLGRPQLSRRIAEMKANVYRFGSAPIRCDVREHNQEVLEKAHRDAQHRRFASIVENVANAKV